MSWGFNIPPTPKNQFIATVLNAQIPENPTYPVSDEAKEQLTAAKTAALSLFSSGAVGESDFYSAYLGGHANPNHEKTPGYAHDFISVAVYHADAPVITARMSIDTSAYTSA